MGSAGRYDLCSGCAHSNDAMIYNASTPTGCAPILKTLMSNECNLDCKYCPNSASHTKLSFEPEELARVFFGLWKQKRVIGLFLSSGVNKDPDISMEKIIECARIVRTRYSFRGYIHLKVLPGTGRDSIRSAARLADRLSINLETPSKSFLSEIAFSKDYGIDLLRRQRWIAQEEKRGFLRAGHTTQFIVGAAGENDLDVLSSLANAYENTSLRRGYFSAFDPVPGTPLEKRPATPKSREFRLYQSDFLLREYRFQFSEVESIFNEKGFLPNADPKVLLAREFLEPVDADTAPYSELIKVPGVGPKTARNILQARSSEGLDKKRLAMAGVILKRALPFLRVKGSVQARLSKWL